MDNSAAATIARILKVNHGGEHGAIRIYEAQIAAARWRCREAVPALMDLLSHERRHERVFRELMPARMARPCRLMWLWGWGGLVLGLLTGLLGRAGVHVCTRAVERTVHAHLSHQLAWLDRGGAFSDPDLRAAIADIQKEEEAHLAWAEAHAPAPSASIRALDGAITLMVEALIWLSTNGESGRLSRQMKVASVGRGGCVNPDNRSPAPDSPPHADAAGGGRRLP